MMKTLAIALGALLLAQPALASGKPEGEEKSKLDVGQYVDLSVVAVPIVVDRRLVNYVFIRTRLNLTTRADVAKARAKEPIFRDALVRAAHRTPLTNPKDLHAVDEARFKALMTREAIAVAGPGVIKSVELSSQAPLKRLRRPPA